MTTIFGGGDFDGDGSADVMARDSSGRLSAIPPISEKPASMRLGGNNAESVLSKLIFGLAFIGLVAVASGMASSGLSPSRSNFRWLDRPVADFKWL